MKWIRILVILLTLYCFGYSFFLWGGLKATPEIGKLLVKGVKVDTPCAVDVRGTLVAGQVVNKRFFRRD